MALGGMLTAVAVVIMCMGSLIPLSTYLCPVLCILITRPVLERCGKRIAWAWYGAVSVLSLLMAPDKEAAAVFFALGYYPILKPRLDRSKWKWLWKVLLFNSVILLLYWLLLNVMGLAQLTEEFGAMGVGMTVVTLLLGNVTFFALDKVLGKEKLRVK